MHRSERSDNHQADHHKNKAQDDEHREDTLLRSSSKAIILGRHPVTESARQVIEWKN